MISKKEGLKELRDLISKEKKVAEELASFLAYLEETENPEQKKMIQSQINSLKEALKKINKEGIEKLGKILIAKPLPVKKELPKKKIIPKEKLVPLPVKKYLRGESKIPLLKPLIKSRDMSKLEKRTIKRLKKKEKKVLKEKERKPNFYVRISNKVFSKYAFNFAKANAFETLERNLIKSNLQFILPSYISVIFFTTLLSVFFAIFIFLFFMFFNIGATLPILTLAGENFLSRFPKVFWVLFAIPIATFLITYYYPSLEKKSIENRINQELPFATIHMSAIAGSMVEPSKIFNIIILTKEYPYLERELVKLVNQINIYGYNLVRALRDIAFNSPSRKLADLFNGLTATITSGGNLPAFFEKRAQSFLFEHRLEREKQTKAAETFMDIYISVVIAAPMILMLLLMMMKISGLGVSLTTTMITIIMVLGVSTINIIFLTFLHLKQK